jgi:HEAT repeat protein
MPLIKHSLAAPQASQESPASLDALLADLKSIDPVQRRGAARKLAEYPESARDLCSTLAAEPHESVRESIFTALIRIGTKPAAEGLVPLLNSEDPGLRNGAIEALKTMPDAVAERIGDIFAGSSDVRIFGVEILGALAHPDSPRWLMRIIAEDTELNVCAAAVGALAECGDGAAVAPLCALLERFPNEPFLEFSVRAALARIENG